MQPSALAEPDADAEFERVHADARQAIERTLGRLRFGTSRRQLRADRRA